VKSRSDGVGIFGPSIFCELDLPDFSRHHNPIKLEKHQSEKQRTPQ
jgi:hypothetical protein